jgi:hypothetical protein
LVRSTKAMVYIMKATGIMRSQRWEGIGSVREENFLVIGVRREIITSQFHNVPLIDIRWGLCYLNGQGGVRKPHGC